MKKIKKIKKTFTLDEKMFNEFSRLADSLAINKSKFVNNKLKEFIKLNSDE